ncbi:MULTISPECIES: hypothetical protein [Sphaerochaeta]|jgi:predicted amidophosphoribosyltransferase|uniref:Phosphoribosyltransferase domain-containing protein n=1 Tax=bioreactor metagenome TaxID=1076179 RepID=A0A644W1M3_9ZZZZ|nr:MULTISPECIES: hypothetical protein [Sphaerochaeta]MDT3358192.1 hypothetical protein [Spirochaetota bacterium]NLA98661.1 ComF family protein [Spirochaetales bacterium]MDD2394303.1 hypothetical protein [Sphaerochaeta sp.]MDD3423441.1 hypothetical protein [Sphaerochaeta sp.]MDD3456801.1 hypothetical protein [Sphaerochaeta sp.]
MWCLTCNALSDAPLCSGCRKKLASLSYAQLYEHRCPTCGTPVLDTAYGCDFCQDALLSYGVYDGILEQLITSYKHAGNVQAAWQLATLFEPLVRKFGSPILIPIPSSISGKRNLGFDHMALVTAILCRRLHLSSVRLLAQQRHDLYTLLTRKQRQQTNNLILKKKALKNMQAYVQDGTHNFLILDDIFTTGNTCRRARELIQTTGDVSVGVCILARA